MSGILLFGKVSGKSNQDEKSLALFVGRRITIVYILDGNIKQAFIRLRSGRLSLHIDILASLFQLTFVRCLTFAAHKNRARCLIS